MHAIRADEQRFIFARGTRCKLPNHPNELVAA